MLRNEELKGKEIPINLLSLAEHRTIMNCEAHTKKVCTKSV